jgi:hypothetical protein
MTRFLRTEDHDLINVDQISRIEADGKDYCKGQLHDGKTVRFFGEFDRIEELLCPVIAAPPSYMVLEYHDGANNCDDGEPWVVRMPVLAWRITGDAVAPVTPDSEGGGRFGPASTSTILLPDGQVTQQDNTTWPNEESWREEMAKQAKSKREQEAAKKSRPTLSSVKP